jgi:hypothetical protein
MINSTKKITTTKHKRGTEIDLISRHGRRRIDMDSVTIDWNEKIEGIVLGPDRERAR